MPNIIIGENTYDTEMITAKEASGDKYAFYKYISSGYITDELPSGYTLLPYVNSTPKCFFNTDYVGKLNTWFKFMVLYNNFGGSVITDRSNQGSGFRMSSDGWSGYNHGNSVGGSRTYTTGTVYEVEAYKNNDVIINGDTFEVTSGTKTNTNVFSIGEENQGVNGKLYRIQIYEGDTLVRNYLPCINDQNVAGFYETLSATFHASDGTAQYTG